MWTRALPPAQRTQIPRPKWISLLTMGRSLVRTQMVFSNCFVNLHFLIDVCADLIAAA